MQSNSQQQNQIEPEQHYSYGYQQPSEGTYQSPLQLSDGIWQQMPQQSYQAQYSPQYWQPQPLQGSQAQPMYVPQVQQQMYPYSTAQPVMMMPQQIVNVNIQKHQHSLFVRALYFIFIGWWAGLVWLNIGYFFVLTIIGLPIGLMMLNRLPTVLTLKPANQSVNVNIVGSMTTININETQQVKFLLRALYFIFVGWWAGLAWSWLAYAMFVFIVTIPVGIMMLNILPTIITLRKN